MQGIPFNEQGVTGILASIKTNTRRPLKNVTVLDANYKHDMIVFHEADGYLLSLGVNAFIAKYAKYKIGETVFVQEEFLISNHIAPVYYADAVTTDQQCLEWQSASEMTEQQSRIKLKIIGIKVERLQNITIKDALKEGMGFPIGYEDHKECFARTIWQPLPYPPKYQWPANPHVFAYEFEVVT